MPDTKITALAAITTVDPAADVLPIVDISDTSMAASGTTKKITSNQILGAGGTATLASATISGNLTVDTNTLFVDAANDRVGMGTLTPVARLIVRDGANRNLLVASDASHLGSAGIAIGSFTDNAADWAPLSLVAKTSIAFGLNGTTAMTLNSTGLGVGVSPAYSIQSYGTAPAIATGGTTTMSAAGTIGASLILRSESTSAWTGTREMVSFDSIGNGADHRIGGLSIKLKATSGASSLTEYLQINPWAWGLRRVRGCLLTSRSTFWDKLRCLLRPIRCSLETTYMWLLAVF
jgi:hypothetical protein